MASIVLDASVGAKWYLSDEEDGDRALRLLQLIGAEAVTVVAPGLLIMEVAHALVRASSRGRISAASVSPAIDALVELDLVAEDPPDLVSSSTELALRSGLTVYDAAYLVFAKSHGATLVTADRRLHEAGLTAGYDVTWLGDLPPDEPAGSG